MTGVIYGIAARFLPIKQPSSPMTANLWRHENRVSGKLSSWDEAGKLSPWSKTAYWEMGLLATNDWQAQWITRTTNIGELPAPFFRRELELIGKVKKARVYICGLWHSYELHINGRKRWATICWILRLHAV